MYGLYISVIRCFLGNILRKRNGNKVRLCNISLIVYGEYIEVLLDDSEISFFREIENCSSNWGKIAYLERKLRNKKNELKILKIYSYSERITKAVNITTVEHILETGVMNCTEKSKKGCRIIY